MTRSLEAADVKFNPETKRWTAPRYTKREFDSLGVEKFEQFRNLDTLINLEVTELGEINDLIQTDDGKGIDTNVTYRGLDNLTTRADECDGAFTIETTPRRPGRAGGTTLTWTVPLVH